MHQLISICLEPRIDDFPGSLCCFEANVRGSQHVHRHLRDRWQGGRISDFSQATHGQHQISWKRLRRFQPLHPYGLRGSKVPISQRWFNKLPQICSIAQTGLQQFGGGIMRFKDDQGTRRREPCRRM